MPNNIVRSNNSDLVYISNNQTVSSNRYITVDHISPMLTTNHSITLEDNAPKTIEMKFPDGTSYTFRTANGFKDFWETAQKFNEVDKKNQILQESLAKVAETLVRECPQYKEWVDNNFKELYNG